MRPDIFLATIGRGSNGSNALEVTEDRAAVTAESQDNIINRVNNVSQYGPSWHYVPGIGVAGTAYAEVPGSATGDLAFSRASSKTRTNAAGLIQTIGNNVPPHDYRNADGTLSTFPRLNLEPQRTNFVLRSEEFDSATWTKNLTTVVANAEISPDGTQDAETMTVSTSASFVDQTVALTAGTYTFSVYVKVISQTTAGQMRLQAVVDGVGLSVNFTPTTQWQRFTSTYTAGATLTNVRVRGQTFVGTVAVWGAQLETGTYATTYIPTTTAAVTRIADVANKTGVSSLIGQTEGTVFFDANFDDNNTVNFSISDGTSLNYILIDTTSLRAVNLIIQQGGFTQAQLTTANSFYTSGTRLKCAIAYKQNDFAFYINGTLIGTDNSGTVPACAQIRFSRWNGALPAAQGITQAALIKTRLTNAQLAQMTTL